MTARAGRQSNQQWASSFSFLSQARAHRLENLPLSRPKPKSYISPLHIGAISIVQSHCCSSTFSAAHTTVSPLS